MECSKCGMENEEDSFNKMFQEIGIEVVCCEEEICVVKEGKCKYCGGELSKLKEGG